MCHFITAVLPKSAPHEEIDVLAQKFGRQFKLLSNPSIESQIQSSEAYFLTTRGYCDCGTPLGALRPNKGKRKSLDIASHEKQMRQKGWSEAKIARSLTQKLDKITQVNEAAIKSNGNQASSWCTLISELLDSGKTPYVGLLLHYYSGSLESRIEVSGRVIARKADVTPDYLGTMQEDVLYEFRK